MRSLEKVVRLSAEFTDDEAVLDALAEFRDSKEERNMSGWFTKIINENQEKGEIRRGEAAAVRMIRKNYPDEEIADITELSLERIRELRASVAV